MKRAIGSSRAAWVLALALAVPVHPAWAETRSYTVFRAKTPPQSDGSLDDECWRAVPWQSEFTFPGGAEVGPPFQTQFAMAWDDQCLYVAVRALEPEMDRLVTRAPRGSNDLFRDDHVEIFLCPDTERSNWRQFLVNPLGCALDFTYADKKVATRQVLPEAAPWRCSCASRTHCWEVVLAIPLAELKIEPREGAAFSGNLVRVRAVDQPAQDRTTWAPQTRYGDPSDAFVTFRLAGLPPPEAAGWSLAVDQGWDRVTTVSGERFTGRVLGLDEDGRLRLRCPEFPDEVRVRASAVDRIEFPLADPPGTGARIALVNGDFILGEVRSIGAEQTVVANDALGELAFPTSALSEIRLGAAARSCVDTPFDAVGDMDPWLAVRGKWSIEKGRLTSPGDAAEGCAIAVVLPQDGPITFEAEVELSEDAPFDCDMVLFAGQAAWPSDRSRVLGGPPGQNGRPAQIAPIPRSGVVCAFRGNGYANVAVWNGAQNGQRNASQTLRFAPQPAHDVRLRCSYDPKDGTVSAWQNEQMQGTVTVRNAPKDGLYAVFVGYSPMAIRRLRVMPGIVPPGGEPKPAAGAIRVALTNGDVITAQSVTLSDGRFSLQTDHGEARLEPDQIASIRFAAPAAKPPERNAAVRVAGSDGRFTLRSCTLSAGGCAGQSEILGAISILRDRVRSIQFLRGTP